MISHFRVQSGPFVLNIFFLVQIIITSSAISPFHCAKFLKKKLTADPPELSGCTIFCPKMGHFPKWNFFSEKLLISLVSFYACLSTSQKSKSDINLLIKYWRLNNTEKLIGRGPFLAIIWEPDFCRACSVGRMLMNHKNFCFTEIPDKTNDVIFLKSPKPLFKLWLTRGTIYDPLIPCKFRREKKH